MKDATRIIRSGTTPKPQAKTVGPAVQRGSTVLLPNAAALYDEGQVTYGRQGLAVQDTLCEALAAMEGGVGATLYPSGLAAVTGALLAVLKSGDRVLVADTIYKPTRRFCDRVLARFGVQVSYFDPRIDPERLVGETPADTRMIVLESPGSLTFEMQDVGAVAALARARGLLTLADNTWAAGYLFRPLEHGVDLSAQALTKYVGGHSDAFMGSVVTRDAGLLRALQAGVVHLGWSVSPDDAYQMLRGLRTLPTRLARQGESGLAVARWLAERPEVACVLHPPLPGVPGHELWARDYSGACGLFAFALQPAPTAAVDAFLDALELFGLGFSWGGFESLAISCDPQLACREHLRDYPGPLVRLHVGLEDPDDLVADLEGGLEAFRRARG